MSRNLALPHVMLAFVFAVALPQIVCFFGSKVAWAREFIVTILVFLFTFNFYSRYDAGLLENVTGLMSKSNCGRVAANVGGNLVSNRIESLPVLPAEYELKSQLQGFINSFDGIECVLIRRSGMLNQYTNYILPTQYDLLGRKGDYFFFKRKS